jgi:hypothetical protein
MYCHCGCGELAPIAPRTSTTRGWIKGQPQRYLRGHSGHKYTPIEIRYIVDENGCWVWQLFINVGGYGAVRKDGKQYLAHRLAYIEKYGDIPSGLQLDHLCRNRRCINPDHLEPVTHATNGRRGKAAKITKEIADKIKELYSQGLSTRAIAKLVGISKSAVYCVVSGQTWERE